ncbi:TPA_asm: putative protein ninB [Cyanophage Cy-LDV1]|nr:TPA_asm: putative protein ninB [Cyanophage Cy-LDV1]
MAATAKKPKRQPVYLEARRLVDPATGEEIGALVPASPYDSRRLRALKLGQGQSLRAELSKPRNVKFHRLVHALGQLLADHWPAFAGLPAHEAIKRAQVESGTACDQQAIDLGPLGKAQVEVARSLAFDSMDEAEFGELFAGLTRWIDENVIAHFPEEARAEYWLMTGDNR